MSDRNDYQPFRLMPQEPMQRPMATYNVLTTKRHEPAAWIFVALAFVAGMCIGNLLVRFL